MACPVNITASTGIAMPALGFGTWQAKEEVLEAALEAALSAGYRHIDTAWVYENEHVVGKVLKRWLDEGKVSREELFIVTKLPAFGNRPGDVERYMTGSLEKLQLSYVDLYLIHFPVGLIDNGSTDRKKWTVEEPTDHLAIWKEMEKQVDQGRTKAIGVSNFNIKQVERLLQNARIKPTTNQIELHLYLQQPELVEYLQKNNVIVTAYSPLGTPGIQKFFKNMGVEKEIPDLLSNPVVVETAQKHNKTSAQVMLRYLVQNRVVAIPKSTSPDRIQQNINIFDFELDADDLGKLKDLDINHRIINFTDIFPAVGTHPEFPF